MPQVLSYANNFPGIPVPQHIKTNRLPPTTFRYPGAVQPRAVVSVLTPASAFPAMPFPNHNTGAWAPQSFLFSGAIQPGPFASLLFQDQLMTVNLTGTVQVTVTVHNP